MVSNSINPRNTTFCFWDMKIYMFGGGHSLRSLTHISTVNSWQHRRTAHGARGGGGAAAQPPPPPRILQIAIFGGKSGNIRAKPLDIRTSNWRKKIFGQETSAPSPPAPPPPQRNSSRTLMVDSLLSALTPKSFRSLRSRLGLSRWQRTVD